MMRALPILISLIFYLHSIKNYSQDYKFGKISKEELSETIYQKDSSANAAILYESKEIRVDYSQTNGFQLITNVHKRIKIYDKQGFEHASEVIFLYKNGKYKEKLSGLKGYTYNLDNNKIEEIKLKGEGIFEEEFSENYDQKKFTLPGIKEGSILEFKYQIISPFLGSIDRIFLQYKIPVKKISISFSSPEYYFYKKFSSGFLPIDIKETQVNDKIILNSKTRTGWNITKTEFNQQTVSFITNVQEIEMSDVPAFKEEPFSSNIENYISSLSYELSYVKFPNEPIDYRSTTWEDVTKTVFKNSKFGGELKKSNFYQEDLDRILNEISGESERIIAIFNFVKNKMTWNGKYGVISTNGLKQAYKENTGNIADINLLLTSMLQKAGLDTNPVIATTEDRMISLFPNLSSFNYVLTRVKLSNGNLLYLDATDKYGTINTLPDHILKGLGRVIDKNGNSQMVTFRPEGKSLARYSVQYKINQNGNVEGTCRVVQNNYLAKRYRDQYYEKDSTKLKDHFIKDFGMSRILNYEQEGLYSNEKAIKEKFSFILDNQADVIENEIYFSPVSFLKHRDNIFKSEQRSYPVDFGVSFDKSFMINIEIPEEYEIVEIPQSGGFKLPDNLGYFTYSINKTDKVIQLMVKEIINEPIILSNHYIALKQFYDQIIQKEDEQIVLKRI